MSWRWSREFGWRWAPLYLVGTSRSHASNPAPLLKECLHATLRGQRWILRRAVTKQFRLTSSLRPGRRCTDPCLLTCKFLGSGTCSSLVCSGQIIKLLPAIGLSWFRRHYFDTVGCTYWQYQAPTPLCWTVCFKSTLGECFSLFGHEVKNAVCGAFGLCRLVVIFIKTRLRPRDCPVGHDRAAFSKLLRTCQSLECSANMMQVSVTQQLNTKLPWGQGASLLMYIYGQYLPVELPT